MINAETIKHIRNEVHAARTTRLRFATAITVGLDDADAIADALETLSDWALNEPDSCPGCHGGDVVLCFGDNPWHGKWNEVERMARAVLGEEE